jgi:hypothetical protein
MTLLPLFRLVLTVREAATNLTKKFEKSEDDLQALQSVGQVRPFETVPKSRSFPLLAVAASSPHCASPLPLSSRFPPPPFLWLGTDHWRGAQAAGRGEMWGPPARLAGPPTCWPADWVWLGAVIVKASSGPRYVVACRRGVRSCEPANPFRRAPARASFCLAL